MKKILPLPLLPENLYWLDISEQNKELLEVELVNTQSFSDYVFDQIPKGKIGIGGWLENRAIYKRSEHFQQNNEARTIHLGLDLWTDALTPIFTPVACKVHSFKNNVSFGDYGPTIITEHLDSKLGNIFTLYGHLSQNSISKLKIGQYFDQGDQIGEVGNFPENGGWPPHLHFQLMKSMEGKFGDFPGVCSVNDLDYFSKICIDPLEFLGIKKELEN
ncbi:Peptidase family M23 [Spirosomataceae bacterium TFI 002]|nr:Peptidase family M23 [Spirosomataceae bacterium TFI 002]